MNNIIILPKETRQDEFFDENGRVRNGGCIIAPTVCTCTKELNGCFELYIELVNPNDNVMKYISCWNYVVAPVRGRWDNSSKISRKKQIFYIISIEKSSDQNGTVNIKMYAKHIFYTLSYRAIDSYYWDNEKKRNCYDTLIGLRSNGTFKFEVEADRIDSRKVIVDSDKTYINLIMDDGGLLQTFKVELHRDNFYFSAKSAKEFSKGNTVKPAFRLLSGKEINSITETIDYTDIVTRIDVVPEDSRFSYGRGLSVPHFKLGMPYSSRRYFRTSSDKELSQQQAEASTYFSEINHPQQSYTIILNTLEQSNEFCELSGLMNCDIGDIGLVYSSLTHTNAFQKITKVTEDVLQGKYTEVILGNVPGSIARLYDNTSAVGMQIYSEIQDNGGGFTADVTVDNGKNKVCIMASTLIDGTDENYNEYDAIVDFGDTYKVIMSSQPQHYIEHFYAYNGVYTLRYSDCFDRIHLEKGWHYPPGIDSGIVMGEALHDAGATDSHAFIDNIIFYEGTKQIGQCRVISSIFHQNSNGTVESLGVFRNCPSITKITIPKSVEYISCKCFPQCLNLKEIFYSGTISDWIKVWNLSQSYDKKYYNTATSWIDMYNVTVHCTDGDTIQPGELGVNPKYGV